MNDPSVTSSQACDEPFLEVSALSKQFHGSNVLTDLNFSVKQGEVVSVIGPSGAGKSTFLRCLNVLETPTVGTIRLGDVSATFAKHRSERSNVIRKLRKQTGMVFQSFNLYPHLTVLNNVVLPQRRVLKRSKQESTEIAMDLLASVGLAEKAHQYPAECSGGQQQRVAIARALALKPALMLFDEPTSALDPEVGVEILRIMKDLADSGLTMIIVTHEIEFARNVSDRVVVMVDGEIIESGPPEEVISNPSHERTKQFIGATLRSSE